MEAGREPHRDRLGARHLARIGRAGEDDRAVQAQLEGGRSFDPGQVLAAALHAQLAGGVEDVPVRGLQIEPEVAIGKVEGARCGWTGRSIPRQRRAEHFRDRGLSIHHGPFDGGFL